MHDLKKINIQELQKVIDNTDKIVIVPHKNPDGDAIGSSLGLYHYLKSKNKDCAIVVNDAFPEFLSFLPGSELINVYESKQQHCTNLINEAGLIFCTDYAQLHRCGELQPHIESSSAIKAVIDHHPGHDEHFNFYYHLVAASSTSELVYLLIKELEPPYIFSKDAASCLYTGLMSDTGCFRYALRPETFMVASQLIKSGISTELLVSNIYDSNSPERIHLIGFALNEKMQVLQEYRTAFISISYEESERLRLKKGDTEGLVNYTLSIHNMVMGAFFYEKEKGKTKISLRSKGNFAVNEISQKYFSGGGHKNAAGGEFEGSTEDALKKFMEILPQYKAALVSLEIGKKDA